MTFFLKQNQLFLEKKAKRLASLKMATYICIALQQKMSP